MLTERHNGEVPCTNLTSVCLTSKFIISIKFDVKSKLKFVSEFHVNHISVQYFICYFEQIYLHSGRLFMKNKIALHTHVTKIHKLFLEYFSVR
jgi:hypothetical protein